MRTKIYPLSDGMGVGEKHKKGQARILGLCFAAYASAYFLRLNFPVAMPLLESAEGYTNAQLGLVASLYFAMYTGGQLLNGCLGDYISSKKLLITGLCVSIVCNIGCCVSENLVLLGICWTINGFAQSMLWGPILHTLSQWYDSEELERVSFYMSFTGFAGYIVSWVLSSFLGERHGWKAVFAFPVMLVLVVLVLVIKFFQDAPEGKEPLRTESEGKRSAERCATESVNLSIGKYLLAIQMPLLFIVSAALGIIREGMGAWFPTLLRDMDILPEGSSWKALLAVPFLTLSGILSVRCLVAKLKGNVHRILLCVYPFLSLLSLLLLLAAQCGSKTVSLIIMALLLAVAQGTTMIFASLIPFHLSSYGRVSLTAGILDGSIYCGATASNLVTGLLLDDYTWNHVYGFWALSVLVGTLSVFCWVSRHRGN